MKIPASGWACEKVARSRRSVFHPLILHCEQGVYF